MLLVLVDALRKYADAFIQQLASQLVEQIDEQVDRIGGLKQRQALYDS